MPLRRGAERGSTAAQQNGFVHDAFRKALEEPKIASLLDRFDQPTVYMSAADYTKFARQTYEAEKATIERLGLKGTM